MRLLVYTCVFGGYDRVYPPVKSDSRLDYVIVTENKTTQAPGWRTHLVDISSFPTHKAANLYYRALIHRILLGYDASLYVDGNVRLLGKTFDVIYPFLASEMAIGVFPHPWRNSVAEEIKACIRTGKADPEKLMNELKEYNESGFRDDQSLIETGVLLKNHRASDLDTAMEMWWRLFMRYCSRDQISLPYVRWKTGVSCYFYNFSYSHKCPYFYVYPHLKNPNIPKLYTHLAARQHDSLLHKVPLKIWQIWLLLMKFFTNN